MQYSYYLQALKSTSYPTWEKLPHWFTCTGWNMSSLKGNQATESWKIVWNIHCSYIDVVDLTGEYVIVPVVCPHPPLNKVLSDDTPS